MTHFILENFFKMWRIFSKFWKRYSKDLGWTSRLVKLRDWTVKSKIDYYLTTTNIDPLCTGEDFQNVEKFFKVLEKVFQSFGEDIQKLWDGHQDF